MKRTSFFILCLLVFISCSKTNPVYEHPDDALTDLKSSLNSLDSSEQVFEFDPGSDRVIKGANGTMIIIPKGCFLDKDGKTVDKPVRFHLKEALHPDEIMLSGLSTVSNDKLLKTGGMLYIKVKLGDELLSIDSKKPLYIEVPAKEKIPGMMAYRGVRQADGNINWVDPKPLIKNLVTVDLNLLDFLPEGFAAGVEKGMPYRRYKTATPKLIDSLYFSLSTASSEEVNRLEATNLNEPVHLGNLRRLKNGKYGRDAYVVNQETDTIDRLRRREIDPAAIKVLKNKKFQNSFIATREFEKRLKSIFYTCNNSVLETYLNHIHQDMWISDSIAATQSGCMKERFQNFAAERLGNVANPPASAEILQRYYRRQLDKVKSKLEKLAEKYSDELKHANKAAAELGNEYRELLFERESYRMQKYAYEWSDTGWANIDVPADAGTTSLSVKQVPKEIRIMVENGAEMDRVLCYNTYFGMKSIYRMNSVDKKTFVPGSTDNSRLMGMLNDELVVVAIAYKGDKVYADWETYTLKTRNDIQLRLNEISKKELRRIINRLSGAGRANDIAVDLEYQAKFYKEQKRQETLMKEEEFRRSLENLAFPCSELMPCGCQSDRSRLGEVLFSSNCSSCHAINERITGPALLGVTWKRDRNWLFSFIRNSQAMIKSGDPQAMALYKEYNRTVMNSFEDLSEYQISAILEFISCKSGPEPTPANPNQ